MDLEFLDESSGGDDLGDSNTGRRTPRWVVAAVVAVLLVLAASVVLRHPDSVPVAAAPKPSATVSDITLQDRLEALDPTAAALLSLSRRNTPLTDIVRSGSSSNSCSQVRLGTSPQQRVSQAIIRTLGEFRKIDSGRVIDQFAALCSLRLRAYSARYLMIAMITSPTKDQPRLPSEYIQSSEDAIPGGTIAYVRLETVDGWTVVVGTVGRQRASDEDLTALAHDRAIRW